MSDRASTHLGIRVLPGRSRRRAAPKAPAPTRRRVLVGVARITFPSLRSPDNNALADARLKLLGALERGEPPVSPERPWDPWDRYGAGGER